MTKVLQEFQMLFKTFPYIANFDLRLSKSNYFFYRINAVFTLVIMATSLLTMHDEISMCNELVTFA